MRKAPSPALREKASELPDTLAFMRTLWAVDHSLRTLSKRMQRRIGLTGPQRLALRAIGRFPDSTPSEIAELLHLDRGTLTGVLTRLTARGLVSRTSHPTDGRRAMLRLTKKGDSLDNLSAGTVEACMRRALALLSKPTVDAARDALETIARELEREITYER